MPCVSTIFPGRDARDRQDLITPPMSTLAASFSQRSLLDLLEFLASPFSDGTAPHRELASPGGAAHGRKAEAVEGLWLPLATPLASFACPVVDQWR